MKPKGELDLHGKLFKPTWTRLDATASVGDRKIKLKQKVNWVAGQQIVVTTTIWRDEWNDQNEVMQDY